MKRIIKKQLYRSAIASLFVTVLLMNCGKYKEIADAEYPDQVIYMPTANADGKPYVISASPDTWETPTPGAPYRFRVDENTGKIAIPLGVVRGGKDNTGGINIDIHSRPDTVNTLVSNGLSAQLLPQSAYTLPSSSTIADGKSSTTFELLIDQTFLKEHPGVVFGIGVSISSRDRQTNPVKETTVIVFDTGLLID